MAFLFKSKKNHERALASRDGNTNSSSQGSQGSIQSPVARLPREEKSALHQRSTPTGSLSSIDNDNNNGALGSPDRPMTHARRGGSVDNTQQQSDLPLRNGPLPPAAGAASSPPAGGQTASPYPWSQRRLTYASSSTGPFPRYGAAVNATSSKEGDIYIMGGLINSSTVKGDLWMIEAGGNMACYPLATTAEGPGPRVGHASLLVGNAFIVYGGDTKIEESDVLDETLYLLNTSTRHWSRALPAGPRPAGRYGHTLNILGSKIYIFGGQVEGFFMNDLSAFDLNQLQMPNNRWELLMAGEASPKVPAARTNHSIITYNDKMYLFGGTNGFQWFNDVWCYDPGVNAWTQLDCIGFIPAPREGHAAALVDDVMYVFGGRTEEGTDMGDLAAFRLPSRRWYTFQNMGPSPSPRSGHSMTTVGKSIVVLGGEPSTAAPTVNDLGILYVLDTSKIRYPNEAQVSSQRALAQARRPSTSAADMQSSPRTMTARDGPSAGPPDSRKLVSALPPSAAPLNGPKAGAQQTNTEANGSPSLNSAATTTAAPSTTPTTSKLPRATAAPSPAGPPPSGPSTARPTVDTAGLGRVRGMSAEGSGALASPRTRSAQSPMAREATAESDAPAVNGQRAPGQQAGARGAGSGESRNRGSGPQEEPSKVRQIRHGQSQGSVDSSTDSSSRAALRPSSPPPPSRQTSNPLSRRSSGRNSQTVALLKELDTARNKNAWYASELELARKAGYVTSANFSPTLESRATDSFDEEDRPLIEALLAMRTELANVQSSVDKQAMLAARQVAEAEKQRDAAIQEAVYAKAKMAAHVGGSANSTPQPDSARDDTSDRTHEVSRKLASTLQAQKKLQSQLDSATAELEAEKKARALADDTAAVAQKRTLHLETYKQQTSSEVERLKAELHLVQREAREQSVACAEAVAALALLKVDKDELDSKYSQVLGNTKDHKETLESLKSAIVASQDARAHLEKKLEEERLQRESIEEKFNQIKAEHETRTAELATATQRLKDAQELAEKHVKEAKTHRQAVLSGLDKMSARDVGQATKPDAGRVAALQAQIAASSGLVKKYKEEADVAADKLRSAEERIAGLEQYQEQSSREGVSIRRQLQSSLKEVQSLQSAHSEIQNQLAAQQLETNAMTVQHNALKEILNERGISPTAAVRARGLASPRTASPEQTRLRDLEAQLASASAAHEETKQAFAAQAHESENAYREKLGQLESDYQSAVHYVKGTEKMLKQLKDQLSRYKTENGRLKSEVEELENRVEEHEGAAQRSAPPPEWESERSALHKRVQVLEAELSESGNRLEKTLEDLKQQLSQSNRRRDEALRSSDEASKSLTTQRKDLEQLRSENALLEQRATDAEQKVSLLLDQVEHSVDNYRRRSRQAPSFNSEAVGESNGLELGHSRNESNDSGSAYEGNGLDARNSAALDNLASELETLRSHWEATNKNYRLSSNFDFEQAPGARDDEEGPSAMGLSKSLADWRKRLDTEDSNSEADKPSK